MGKPAVWATQMLWPTLPQAARIVLLVLVSFAACQTYKQFLPRLNSVVGFIDASFSGVEQGASHSVSVGYKKGGSVANQNLVFNVISTPGTASEFTVLIKPICQVNNNY